MVKQRQYLTIAAAFAAATLLFSAATIASHKANSRQSVGRRRLRRIGRKRRPRYGTHEEQQRWFGGQRFTGAARWSRDYRQSYWWTDYVQHPGVNDVGSFLYDEFRATFRIPKPMFDDMLRRMRDSGVFENDNPQGPGRPAAPLSLKLMAVLRLLAIGCHVGAVADMCGIGRTTIQEFFPV